MAAGAHQGGDVDPRDRRAAEEYLVPVKDAPGMFTVYSHEGHPRTVDVVQRVCTCKDFEYRQPAGGCKHLRRVLMELGERPVPAGVDVDPNLLKRRDE